MLNKEHSIIITRNSLPGGSCEEVPPVPATVAGRRFWVSQAICSGEKGAGSPLGSGSPICIRFRIESNSHDSLVALGACHVSRSEYRCAHARVRCFVNYG